MKFLRYCVPLCDSIDILLCGIIAANEIYAFKCVVIDGVC